MVSLKIVKRLGMLNEIDRNTKDKVKGVGGVTRLYGYLVNHAI